MATVTGTGTPIATTATASGLVSEQGSGLMVSFYQDIVLIGAGNLIDFEQTTESSGNSGNLIQFEQVVKSGSGKFSGLLLA